MTRKNKPERLVESVAQQNKNVGRSIEAMVENIADMPEAKLRSDWEEICLTSQLIVVQDLLLPEAGQPPKQSGTAHGRKNSKPKTNGSTHNGSAQ